MYGQVCPVAGYKIPDVRHGKRSGSRDCCVSMGSLYGVEPGSSEVSSLEFEEI